MALVMREDLSDEVQLGLWKIEEKEAYFLRSYPWLQSLFDGILGMRSEQRRAEILSVYALLYEIEFSVKANFVKCEPKAHFQNQSF